MGISELPSKTINLIKSSQVITSTSSIVKELIENGLDAGATTLSVKLENFGFQKLEVKDNGSGIKEEDIPFIALPHFTSKIISFQDLDCLHSYGFRGEALSSLCTVSDVSLSTKRKEDSYGLSYTLDNYGKITDKKAAAVTVGTTITVQNLFKNVPVRRQFYSNTKRRKDELRKIETLIMAFAIAHPPLHISLIHDKNLLFQKSASEDVASVLLSVFRDIAKRLVFRETVTEKLTVKVWLPECINPSCSLASPDKLFVIANERLVFHKAIEKLTKAYYSKSAEGAHGKYPVGVIMISVPPDHIDVNLEPNKTRVLFREENLLLELLEQLLCGMYGSISRPTLESGSHKTVSQLEEWMPCTLPPPSQYKAPSEAETQQPLSLKSSGGNKYNQDKLVVGADTPSPKNIEFHHNKNLNSIGQDSFSSRSDNVSTNCVIVPPILLNTVEDSEKPVSNGRQEITGNQIYNSSTPTSVGQNLQHELRQMKIDRESAQFESESIRVLPPREAEKLPTTPKKSYYDEVHKATEEKPVTVGAMWSKGQVFDELGHNIQTVRILQPSNGTRDNAFRSEISLKRKSPSEESEMKKGNSGGFASKKLKASPALDSFETSSSLMSPAVASPARNPESAFSLFAKSVRKQVIKENPGVDFSVIASELAKRWKTADKLTRQAFEEQAAESRRMAVKRLKKRYNMNATVFSQNSMEQNMTGLNSTHRLSPRTSTPICDEVKSKGKVSSAPVIKPWHQKTLDLQINMEQLTEKIRNGNRLQISSNMLVGNLKGINGWIYRAEDALCTVNVARMNEVILFRKLVGSFAIPTTTIEEPIPLNTSNLATDLWETLLHLDSEKSSLSSIENVITDPRITSNGLRITLYRDSEGKILKAGEITCVPESTSIPNYGIEELKEILVKLHKNLNLPLEELRPSSLRNWFKVSRVESLKCSKRPLLTPSNCNCVSSMTNITNKTMYTIVRN